MTDTYKFEPCLHDDGSYHNFTLTIKGKRFRCECGCNVFTKNKHNKDMYRCNSCKSIYETE